LFFLLHIPSPSQLPDKSLSDHLVRLGEEEWGEREAESLGNLEVDHQVEPLPTAYFTGGNFTASFKSFIGDARSKSIVITYLSRIHSNGLMRKLSRLKYHRKYHIPSHFVVRDLRSRTSSLRLIRLDLGGEN
jgi:hypothetical protein